MNNDSNQRIEFLKTLPHGSHIHVSGVCGTGMSAVASLLKQLGFYVTGSDKAFYPPMGEVVRAKVDRVCEGYSADNLTPIPACVIIGNNLSRGNPEVEFVLENKLPYASMPEVFAALLIGERDFCPKSIVVAGTHGKTTTSAAVTVMFDKAGKTPGYFIGGAPLDLPGGIRKVNSTQPLNDRVVVLEGDEYDSAYFAKWPKFLSYRPDIAIITSIEFDHADIYSSLDEIKEEFFKLMRLVPASGAILICDEINITLPEGLNGKVYYYGSKPTSQFRLVNRTSTNHTQSLELDLSGEPLTFETPLSGQYNALNLLVAAAVGKLCNLSNSEIAPALSKFHGVKRRQQLIGEYNGAILIEDFAHHPSAIEATLKGLRESYPDKKIVALYEPRSNTSRRAYFQDDYPRSFLSADVIVIREMNDAGSYSKHDAEIKPLDISKVKQELEAKSKEVKIFQDVNEIKDLVLQTSQEDVLFVCMTNGDFGGLIGELKKFFYG
jgi:UDP-N-acetylmuramate: L-alanyl-gamma-D-glutamyl-meso-diaminopimelate ligase